MSWLGGVDGWVGGLGEWVGDVGFVYMYRWCIYYCCLELNEVMNERHP